MLAVRYRQRIQHEIIGKGRDMVHYLPIAMGMLCLAVEQADVVKDKDLAVLQL